MPAHPDRDLILNYIRATLLDCNECAPGRRIPIFIPAESPTVFCDHEPYLRAAADRLKS